MPRATHTVTVGPKLSFRVAGVCAHRRFMTVTTMMMTRNRAILLSPHCKHLPVSLDHPCKSFFLSRFARAAYIKTGKVEAPAMALKLQAGWPAFDQNPGSVSRKGKKRELRPGECGTAVHAKAAGRQVPLELGREKGVEIPSKLARAAKGRERQQAEFNPAESSPSATPVATRKL